MKEMISKATEYNWRRLNRSASSRLTSRANKTASKRRIPASSYITNSLANALLQSLIHVTATVADIMYTLCRAALENAGIINQSHVRDFLNTCQGKIVRELYIPNGVFNDGNDVLGFIYQSLTDEGTRNIYGIYYTHKEIVDTIVDRLKIGEDQTVFDPCCGSGAFLLRCPAVRPENLYGFDTDKIAVMIASTNLLIKYKGTSFTPRIFNQDFLDVNLFAAPDIPKEFDYILTNPPWGPDRTGSYSHLYPQIKSNERASMVVVNSFKYLSNNGLACFVLPRSILNTAIHMPLRKYLLSNFELRRIDIFSTRFDGVFTDSFSVSIVNRRPVAGQTYSVCGPNSAVESVSLAQNDILSGEIRTNNRSDFAASILNKMEGKRYSTLSSSRFALGIVTGDNKSRLTLAPEDDAEPVYTGKEVAPLRLTSPSRFIKYNRSEFQQCAPDECYRAPEKLIYRFIAKYPIVAYDDSGSLTLNSANIIIPKLDGISPKSTCVLLNSALYRFYYVMNFKDIKVLKGNLCKIPFPSISSSDDERLTAMFESGASMERIDDEVYSMFDITADEVAYIKHHFENK